MPGVRRAASAETEVEDLDAVVNETEAGQALMTLRSSIPADEQEQKQKPRRKQQTKKKQGRDTKQKQRRDTKQKQKRGRAKSARVGGSNRRITRSTKLSSPPQKQMKKQASLKDAPEGRRGIKCDKCNTTVATVTLMEYKKIQNKRLRP